MSHSNSSQKFRFILPRRGSPKSYPGTLHVHAAAVRLKNGADAILLTVGVCGAILDPFLETYYLCSFQKSPNKSAMLSMKDADNTNPINVPFLRH